MGDRVLAGFNCGHPIVLARLCLRRRKNGALLSGRLVEKWALLSGPPCSTVLPNYFAPCALFLLRARYFFFLNYSLTILLRARARSLA